MRNETGIFMGLMVALFCGRALAQRESNTPVLVTAEIARERASRFDNGFRDDPAGLVSNGLLSWRQEVS